MNKIIKLSEIDSFKNHPFSVVNDESIKELAHSIKENGLINPLIVTQSKLEIVLTNCVSMIKLNHILR